MRAEILFRMNGRTTETVHMRWNFDFHELVALLDCVTVAMTDIHLKLSEKGLPAATKENLVRKMQKLNTLRDRMLDIVASTHPLHSFTLSNNTHAGESEKR